MSIPESAAFPAGPARVQPEGMLVRYLTRTHPAAIFVHAVLLLLAAPVLNAIELWLQPGGVGFGSYLDMTLAGADSSYLQAHTDGPVNPLSSGLIWVIRIATRVVATLGYALPVWAAARLIADALRPRGLPTSQDPSSA